MLLSPASVALSPHTVVAPTVFPFDTHKLELLEVSCDRRLSTDWIARSS